MFRGLLVKDLIDRNEILRQLQSPGFRERGPQWKKIRTFFGGGAAHLWEKPALRKRRSPVGKAQAEETPHACGNDRILGGGTFPIETTSRSILRQFWWE